MVRLDFVLNASSTVWQSGQGVTIVLAPSAFGCEDVLPPELDGDALVVPGGMEAEHSVRPL